MLNKSQFLSCLIVTAVFAAPLTAQDAAAPAATEGGAAGLASRTVLRKQESIKKADTLAANGGQMQSQGLNADAMEAFKGAYELTPDAPATAERRATYFKRYQLTAAAYAQSLADQGELEKAKETLNEVYALARQDRLPPSAIELEVKQLLGRLNGDYFNEAMTPQHLKNVNEVERSLKIAKGALDIGDYDLARKTYNQVLLIDGYNKAARRGLEKVDALIMEYGAAAKAQTRATMMREIAEKWEAPAPAALRNQMGKDFEYSDAAVGSNQANLEAKLRNIVIPSLEFAQTPLSDVLLFLTSKSQELDNDELDPAKRGISFIIQGAEDARDRPVTLKLRNISLEAALGYVTQQVGLKYRVEEFAVALVPLTAVENAALISRTYSVPPDFIQGSGGGGAGAPATNDPFAEQPAANTGTLVTRLTAREFLEQNGVSFEGNATASFNPTTSQLTVRNRPDQIELVEALVSQAKSAVPKNVLVEIRMISIQEEEAREKGFDTLLGQSNLGGNRVFTSGGNFGNQAGRVASDFPFQFGGSPISGGLRSGDTRTLLGIDGAIARENPASGSALGGAAPSIFSVGGVFTDPQFQLLFRGLNQAKSIDRMCEVGVVVKPGQRATIRQVREFIYPTEYDPPEVSGQISGTTFIDPVTGLTDTLTSAAPTTPANPTAFETRELGKIIEVEPIVGDDNRTIDINISTDFTDFSGFINYGVPISTPGEGSTTGVFQALFGIPTAQYAEVTPNRILMPVFDAVKETTNVTIWDGNTVAIGGLVTETSEMVEDKVPVLGDVPLVGRAFRTKIERPMRRGIIIFVTGRVLDPSDLPINGPLSTETTSLPLPTPRNDG